MNSGNEPNVDWTAAPSRGERVGPGLAVRAPQAKQAKRSVIDTLLGQHKLSAYDAAGNDPYNATGRFFRR
jgi:hypothetical protein